MTDDSEYMGVCVCACTHVYLCASVCVCVCVRREREYLGIEAFGTQGVCLCLREMSPSKEGCYRE